MSESNTIEHANIRVGIADKSPLVRAGLQHQPLDEAISGRVVEPGRGKTITRNGSA